MDEQNDEVTLEDTREIELPKLDLTKYIGTKALIEEVTEHKGAYGYYVKISTVPLDVIDTSDEKKEIKASRVIGLHKDAEGNIGWGSDTKMSNFLKKMKVKHYKDLKGTEVIVQTRTNKEGKEFLSFD